MMKLIFITQYLLLSGGWYLFRLVPLRFAYSLGYGIGVTLYILCASSRRVRVTRVNLLITKMAKTRAEATRIARASWGHFFGHIS
jgi:lauroyl/myristoyl acyltransferase